MNANTTFYLCPICFETSEVEAKQHGHPMLRCDAGQPGDERRKPVMDERGNLKSRAPRWFLEAIGSLPAHPAHRAVLVQRKRKFPVREAR